MNSSSLLSGLALILLVQFVGTLILDFLGLSFPPALFSMLFMVALLKAKLIKLSTIEHACTILIEKMGILFVPASVSIILYFEVIRKEWFAILATLMLTSILIMLVTGLFLDFVLRKGGHDDVA